MRVNQQAIRFTDRIQGEVCHQMHTDIGDFVLKRADGLFAYQLAVVVDDASQGITHIVRGADLLTSTTRQILLQQRLSLPTPSYAHVPVASNASGEKLSKQTLAPRIDIKHASPLLRQAFDFLGLPDSEELDGASLDDVWQWADLHWQLGQVPQQLTIRLRH